MVKNKERIRVVVVGGIRTHYIKIHAIQQAFCSMPDELKTRFDVIYVNVGQHYDYALTCHIQSLGVQFDYALQHESKESYDILASIFKRFGELLDDVTDSGKVDYVVVMGDVATTAVVALVAIAKSIKVVHIEGGCRIGRGNGNEEYYRTIADHCSTLCFASARGDYDNLITEGFGSRAHYSGDIMYDYVKNHFQNETFTNFNYIVGNSHKSFTIDKPFVLSSLHHVENIEVGLLRDVFSVLGEIQYNSIFIAHPRVKKFIADNAIDTKQTLVVDAIDYLENLKAIRSCAFCLTDSGGIQREAYYLNKRCIVRSDLTVWKSIVETGSNIVIGKTAAELKRGLQWAEENKSTNYKYNGCFGDGRAVQTIFETILNHYEAI